MWLSNKMSLVPEIRNLSESTLIDITGTPGTITEQHKGQDQMDFITHASSKVTVTVPGFIERLYSLLHDNTTSIYNLVLILIIMLIENTFKRALFTCPCEAPNNHVYGIMFIAAPASAFFVIGKCTSHTPVAVSW